MLPKSNYFNRTVAIAQVNKYEYGIVEQSIIMGSNSPGGDIIRYYTIKRILSRSPYHVTQPL